MHCAAPVCTWMTCAHYPESNIVHMQFFIYMIHVCSPSVHGAGAATVGVFWRRTYLRIQGLMPESSCHSQSHYFIPRQIACDSTSKWLYVFSMYS